MKRRSEEEERYYRSKTAKHSSKNSLLSVETSAKSRVSVPSTSKPVPQKKQKQSNGTSTNVPSSSVPMINITGDKSKGLKENMDSVKKKKAKVEKQNNLVFDPIIPPKETNDKPKEYKPFYKLTDEQLEVLKAVTEGKNVFFSGAAGTGKSLLLERIRRELRKKLGGAVAVTAPTGIAAVNIGGITLHKWAGIGVSSDWGQLAMQTYNHSYSWKRTEVLIIDEISMLSDQLFDFLEVCARRIRGSDEPFGGIQLILAGDFYQLPPVKDRSDALPVQYCFEAKSWTKCIQHSFVLSHVFRQKNLQMIRMLNEIRVGLCSPLTAELLDQCSLNQFGENAEGILPTTLFPTNSLVDQLNSKHLEDLPGDPRTFKGIDSFVPLAGHTAESLHSLLDGCLALPSIELKEKTQVMLLRNLSDSLANGSRGVVVGWHHVSLKEANDSSPVSPWFVEHSWRPIVQFVNGETHAIQPHVFSVEGPWGKATRIQIPLKVAFAVTIHKSQGVSLDRAKVSLSGVFEVGQAYVALSRVRSLDGLQVLDWDPSVIKSNPKVKLFYDSLQRKQPNE